ncbi:hypothetical protein [Bradyrhizobium sacchari]|uniref:hypothetical protein n=1 Tax=Bradyrhizobium sacchari TaxID=1399419 RepID=UPI00142EA659|nr:hypothetical protein [Bradyrhizobium sacchari]
MRSLNFFQGMPHVLAAGIRFTAGFREFLRFAAVRAQQNNISPCRTFPFDFLCLFLPSGQCNHDWRLRPSF